MRRLPSFLQTSLAMLFAVWAAFVSASEGALPPTLRVEPNLRSGDWPTRHNAVLKRNARVKPDIVFIGDSITHYWGGEPAGPGTGKDSWAKLFQGVTVTNLGYGFDYVDNAYYRVLNGELEGISPKLVIVAIGTNNLNHRKDPPEACAANTQALVRLIRERLPNAKILLLGVYPRCTPATVEAIRENNRRIASFADGKQVFYANPGQALLGPDGLANPTLFRDGVHPTAEGYRRLGKALRKAWTPLFETTSPTEQGAKKNL